MPKTKAIVDIQNVLVLNSARFATSEFEGQCLAEAAGIFPSGPGHSTLETAVDNAYSLWLMKKQNKQS